VDRSDAADDPGRKIFLDAVSRGWRRCAEKARPKLLTVSTVVDPFARGCDPLPRRNSCGMANHGHHVTMAACFGAQNAKAVLSIGRPASRQRPFIDCWKLTPGPAASAGAKTIRSIATCS